METADVGVLQTILTFLVLITILVFVHEWGHYSVARLFGIRVDVFSIGFGPEIFGWNGKNGTRWKVSWLPLGGYVKFFGDANVASAGTEGLEEMTAEEKSVSFHHKPLAQKAAVIFAGPAINLIFAVLIFASFFVYLGVPKTAPLVAGVVEDAPAAAAGMEPGDRIIAIEDAPIEFFEELQVQVRINTGTPMHLTVLREGEEVGIVVVPQIVTTEDRFGNQYSYGRLGIEGGPIEFQEVRPVMATVAAVDRTGDIISQMFVGLGQLIRGWRSLDDLAGPVRMAKFAGEQASLGLLNFVQFMALISISLGIVNLFPIPMLDGGHLLFYTIEGVRRRPLHPRFMELAYLVGLALVLSLFLLVTWNDLSILAGN